MGCARWVASLLSGGWYTGLVTGTSVEEVAGDQVRSSHIGCSETIGQLLPGLSVNSASWPSAGTKPACVQLLQQRQGAAQVACLLPAVSSPPVFI